MSCQSPGLCFACVLPICMCYLTLKCVVCVCVCVLNKQSFLVSLVAPDKKESSTPGWLVVWPHVLACMKEGSSCVMPAISEKVGDVLM